MQFTFSVLDERLQRSIQTLGYKKPTEVQEKTVPLITANNDVMVRAQTGTGKTAAFALPLLQKLLIKEINHANVSVLVINS